VTTNRKVLKDRYERAMWHLDQALAFMGEAYQMYDKYGNYYGKQKDFIVAIAKAIVSTKESIQKLYENT